MIANARMYSVTPPVGTLWRGLLGAIAAASGQPLDYVEHAEPASIGELWARQDQGAVFMCGLPYARAERRPAIVAAPVPSPPGFHGQPQYWSELVVHADSGLELIEDTFGHRMAFTTLESQSGCQAALYFLMAAGAREPLYREVIAPRVTPLGALRAVVDGLAEVAPIDSYAFSLLRKHSPELTSKVRIVARTVPTAIPPIVGSNPVPPSLESAFLEAHKNASMGPAMAALQLERFVHPDPASYDVLQRRFEAATAFWREHPFAESVHPAFNAIARS